MTRPIGRLLQFAGLALLPLAMVLELTDLVGPSFGVRDMLIMLVFGASLFYLGRLLEGYSQPIAKGDGRRTKDEGQRTKRLE
jgi:hypothetical protein